MRGLGSGHVTCGPMRGVEINFTGRGQTIIHIHRQTHGHCDPMTDPAQRAKSVKTKFKINCETSNAKIFQSRFIFDKALS